MARPKPRGRHLEHLDPTERDEQIMAFMDANDGIVAKRQIKRRFFKDVSDTALKRRMQKLYKAGFVDKPIGQQYDQAPEFLYWLEKRGYKYVAGMRGAELDRNDPRLKKTETFNPFIIKHHLQVVDVRIKVIEACEQDDRLTFMESITERDFKRLKHKVSFVARSNKEVNRLVIPDWYCRVSRPSVRTPGKQDMFAFLWEIDRGSETQSTTIKDKLSAGVAYLLSDIYKQQLSAYGGRILYVMSSWDRIATTMELASMTRAPSVFMFTTFDDLMSADNALTDAVWQKVTSDEPMALISWS